MNPTKTIRLMPLVFVVTLAAILFLSPNSADAQIAEPQPLKVGDKAPALDVSDWITDGGGKYPAVTEFESGKSYVVEFWATWCGPCIRMMPVIAEMQTKYDGKIRFVSVTDETAAEVKEFEDLLDPNAEQTTKFKEYMDKYTVGADPDGSTHIDFFGNASTGIPHAFVIGETGEIEFAGHPALLSPILEKIADGTWDRDEYIEQQKVLADLRQEIEAAIRREDFDTALDASGKLGEFLGEEQSVELRFERTMFALRLGNEKGDAFFKGTLEQFSKEEGAVAAMVWKVVELINGRVEVSDNVVEESERAMRAVIADLPADSEEDKMMKGATIDIFARLLFVKDRLDEAIEQQEEAVRLLGDEETTSFLDFLKAKKADSETEE